jgi:hypothetical protein
MTAKSLSRNPQLRYDAGLAYMTDPQAPSIERLHRDPRFAKVSKRTLERWCKEDQWVERRQAFFEAWANQARERIGSAQAKARVGAIAALDEVKQMALEKLRYDTVEPKSWEGVARVVVETERMTEELRVAVAGELMPPTAAGTVQRQLSAADLNLTPEEVQTAAKAILQQRRAGVRFASAVTIHTAAPPALLAPSPAPEAPPEAT